jgi:predicted nucleic-acid-binding protein
MAVLETEWVLRDAYEIPREDAFCVLEGLLGLPNVAVSQPLVMRKAITLARAGLDFADALHVVELIERETFATFDKRLAKRTCRRGLSQ